MCNVCEQIKHLMKMCTMLCFSNAGNCIQHILFAERECKVHFTLSEVSLSHIQEQVALDIPSHV